MSFSFYDHLFLSLLDDGILRAYHPSNELSRKLLDAKFYRKFPDHHTYRSYFNHMRLPTLDDTRVDNLYSIKFCINLFKIFSFSRFLFSLRLQHVNQVSSQANAGTEICCHFWGQSTDYFQILKISALKLTSYFILKIYVLTLCFGYLEKSKAGSGQLLKIYIRKVRNGCILIQNRPQEDERYILALSNLNLSVNAI